MGRRAHCGNCSPTNWLTSETSMCTLSASEEPVHDLETDAAEGRVRERLGNGPDDLESQLLPESHGGVVRRHDRIELHRGVPLLFGPGERVLAERAADSSAPRVGGDHEAGGGDVRTRTGTIRSHLRRPEHPRSVVRDDCVTGRRLYPHPSRLLGRPIGVVGVGITSGYDLAEDRPDSRPVVVDVFPDPHRITLITAANRSKRSAIPRLDSLLRGSHAPLAQVKKAPGPPRITTNIAGVTCFGVRAGLAARAQLQCLPD